MADFWVPYNNKITYTTWMKFFNAAMNMAIKAKAKTRKDFQYFEQRGIKCDYEQMMNNNLADQMDTFQTALTLCEQMERAVGGNSFVVTITPQHDTELLTLRLLVEKFVISQMFSAYVYAYEQKGTCEKTLGTHAHCHIVVATSYSKSHVLNKTKQTFASICGEGGMQVDKARTPSNFIKQYLLEHVGRENTDDAKSTTKSTDELWRQINALETLYMSQNAANVWAM